MKCDICPHNCHLTQGNYGFCKVRKNENEKIVCESYGKITSLALDAIEKKPLRRFFPGSKILSLGSFGCNFTCDFCQNSSISLDFSPKNATFITKEELIKKANECVPYGNIGIAYTYNEPLINYEFVYDVSTEARANNLKNVLVTNGFINKQPLQKLLPLIDALNIDLKSINEDFYKKINGDIKVVMQTIELAAACTHVEITTLIIPTLNDSASQMEKLAKYIASIDTNIPLHISRFFPQYKLQYLPPTPVNTVYALADIARKHLKYVYEGNC